MNLIAWIMVAAVLVAVFALKRMSFVSAGILSVRTGESRNEDLLGKVILCDRRSTLCPGRAGQQREQEGNRYQCPSDVLFH